MLWKDREGSENVEDKRNNKKIIAGGIGTVVVAILAFIYKGDPSKVPGEVKVGGYTFVNEQKDTAKQFVSVVLKETEDVWHKLFTGMGKQYKEPKLDLFTGQIKAEGCGYASSTMGPFYCPDDEKIYIDLSYYTDLKNKYHAPGDFAMAYIIAHEVGHHVQKLLGTSDKIHSMRQQSDEKGSNKLSVALELQADFYAGVWAHYTEKMKNILEPGDIEEALNAAQAIGDDRIQQQSTGKIVPDAFTHGTSAQRMYWFKLGYETGDMRKGDTFDPDLSMKGK